MNDTKHIAKSKTIWGLLGAGIAAQVPQLSEGIVTVLGLMGLTVAPEPVSKILVLAGLLFAAYGRMVAETGLKVKPGDE
jgi:hypothetical protein